MAEARELLVALEAIAAIVQDTDARPARRVDRIYRVLVEAGMISLREERRATGAVDLDACPTRTPKRRWCRCGRCARCGQAMHTAIHGPSFGEPPGSKPWGHEFEAEASRRV